MTDLHLSDLGEPFATGRTSRLYAVPGRDDRVLKVFLPEVRLEDAQAEAVRTGVAADAGLTPVRCHRLLGIDGRPALELDRLDGISLTKVGERNPLRIRETARELAREQVRMHEVAAPSLPDVRDVVLEILDRPPMAFLTPQEHAAACDLVRSLPTGDRLLHLDFHPENVFTVPGGGYAVIDWMTAVRGAPAADVAASTFLLKDAELWPGTPALKKALFGIIRRTYFSAYIAEYRARTGLTDAQIARWRLPALVLRLGWDIDSERETLQAAAREALAVRTGGVQAP